MQPCLRLVTRCRGVSGNPATFFPRATETLGASRWILPPSAGVTSLSTQPIDAGLPSFSLHRRVPLEFVEALDLQRINRVV